MERVREAVALAREFSPDAVVGIGGGSAMDVAKCVAVLVGCTGAPAEYLSEPGSIPDSRTTPLTQVPTITGSGSELTSFAAIYVGHHKHLLDHPSARADHFLIDPDLAATVPVPTAAASALDALAQAVESAWAVAATAESRDTAIRALETLLPPLDVATGRGDFADPGLRAELARGAALAGAAINTSRTTAAHALSYALTARHGIAHSTGVPLEELIDRLLRMHGLAGYCMPRRDWQEDLACSRASNNPRLLSPDDVLTRTSRGSARAVMVGTTRS